MLSPSTERIDKRRKLDLYARHGIAHYWIVDPVARAIDAHALGRGAGYRLAGRLHGEERAALPPFGDLLLGPTLIWA